MAHNDVMTHGNLLEPDPTRLPERPDAQSALDTDTDPAKVAAEYPDFSEAWAALAERALADGDNIAAYAYARTGYHRGLPGVAIPVTARVLAAACAFQAMTEARSYRPAVTAKQATSVLRDEVRTGRWDPGAVDAVLAAAGQQRSRRRTGPAGLTPREVEVLSLIARGATTRQVAERLFITPKTAETHIERIYAKTGASTRSTATLFAMQHGLLDGLEPLER